jgi:hypothetical protein
MTTEVNLLSLPDLPDLNKLAVEVAELRKSVEALTTTLDKAVRVAIAHG